MGLAPVALRNNYPALYGPGMLPVLEEIFTAEFEQQPMVRDQIMRVVNNGRDIYQETSLLDMPLFDIIPEGTEYSFKRPIAGPNTTFTPVKYGQGFSISREMVEDGKFDMMAMMSRKLARSARETQEISGMNLLNNGFTTTLSDDGQPLFSAGHVIGGASYSNVPAVMQDLSESSLQAALAQFERMNIGNTGIIYRIRPRTLVVSPENRRYAEELVGSELKADTADNNLNSIRVVDNLRVVSSPHLTDPDAWFVLGDPSDIGLRIVQRQALQTVAGDPTNVGFLNDAYLLKASFRETVGVTNAYGVWGSSGSP